MAWDRNVPICQDRKVFQGKEKPMRGGKRAREEGGGKGRRQRRQKKKKEKLSSDEKTDYQEVLGTHLRSEN